MAKKRKQIYTVHYSISGYTSIDVKAENEDEAMNLADDELMKYDFWNSEDVQFEQEVYQVEDENGDVVWGMS
jgi:hypothetical protein